MMDISWIWLIALTITHTLAYFLGRGDGQGQKDCHSDEAWIEVQKYDIDKRFEYMRWAKERETKHGG